ncbi:MAG TPA: hypothetical protein VFJ91_12385 [Gaiellaceae bacterium]|nr:hypothetical protein [Gaiellaceae bacterium]
MGAFLRRIAVAVVAGLLTAAVGASTGLAGMNDGGGFYAATAPGGGLLASIADCGGYGAGTQVFRPWFDFADYSLAPQGDLASTSDWSLDGATVSSAHDPYGLSAGSLVFAHNGDTATTPWMCVNLLDPTIRFLTVDRGGWGFGSLVVVLRYVAPDGSVQRLPIGIAPAGRSWQPTLPSVLVMNLLSVASTNGWTAVSLELHAVGLTAGETVSADGFYVDPCRSR